MRPLRGRRKPPRQSAAPATKPADRTALFRADANLTLGIGHITRCLALADSLAARGWRSIFACREPSSSAAEAVRGGGHMLLELGDGSVTDEPGAIGKRLGTVVDLTVVDHYGLGSAWHRAARAWSGRLMVIDDLPTRPLDADLVLNQNLGERAIDYAAFVAGDTVLLMGPSFALLRPQFAEARHRFGHVRTSVNRLLVFMGGSDAPDVTSFVANALGDVGLPVDIVIGGQYPHGRHLDATVADKKNFAVHRNVADMAALMLRADLAIGAAGSASWERCCLGLPTVMLTVADNQVRAAAALEAVGAGLDLGWHVGVDSTRLLSAIRHASDQDRIAAMSIAASAVTDGGGAERVADAIEAVTTGG